MITPASSSLEPFRHFAVELMGTYRPEAECCSQPSTSLPY